ncbi:MAG TPA: DUF2798 domain-containing protein [Bacilli bacterium]|nr:DUF2798 domain-containing protein [Bacilli bacterium]
MPKTKTQKFIYALITVIITVNCFVCYCLSIEMGGMSIEVLKNAYSTSFYIWPIPIVVIEFLLAMLCEIFVGSPLSLKMAFKIVDPKKDSPLIIETAIICCTVLIMCPLMSFLATILYHVIPTGTISINFISQFLQTVVINFPFALLSQLFFIQPLVRFIFKKIYK